MFVDSEELIQKLHLDYFKLYELESVFTIDANLLKQKFYQLQKNYHPDNYINQDQTIKDLALRLSIKINDGYTHLNSPLKRAILLLDKHGVAVDFNKHTSLPPQFLASYMELHEMVDQARVDHDLMTISNINNQVLNHINKLVEEIGLNFKQTNYSEILEQVKQLSFLTKFSDMLSELLQQD